MKNKNMLPIRLIVSAMILSLFQLPLLALPQGQELVHGQVEISQTSTAMDIHQSDVKAIIHWDDFSVSKGEKVNFFQPSADATIYNKVVGIHPSIIDGMVKAQGKIILVNPQGVLIGKSGSFSTKGFIATTLKIPEADFLADNSLLLEGNSDAKIRNLGRIESSLGSVYLIAHEVENRGTISAKEHVGLIGGKEVLLTDGNSHALIKMPTTGRVCNEGILKGAQVFLNAAGGNLFSIAVSNNGTIEATGIEHLLDGRVILKSEMGLTDVKGTIKSKEYNNIGGTIHILGEEIEIKENSHLSASGTRGGGVILVGGDSRGSNPSITNSKFVTVKRGALLEANASISGDGGRVVLYSEEYTKHYGHIEASAMGSCGDGGSSEVSAAVVDVPDFPDLRSVTGKAGTFLIDPTTVHIVTGDSSGPDSFGDQYISSYLETSGSLEIATKNSTGGNLGGIDRIIIGSGGSPIDIRWSSDNDLTFTAGPQGIIPPSNMAGYIECVSYGNVINCSGGGSVKMEATSTNGDLGNINGAIDMQNATICTDAGNQTYLGNAHSTFFTPRSTCGIKTSSVTLNTNSGLIKINGVSNNFMGVQAASASNIQALTTGSIEINGEATSAGASNGVNLILSILSTDNDGSIDVTGITSGPSVDGISFVSSQAFTRKGDLTMVGTGGMSGINIESQVLTKEGNITFIGSSISGTGILSKSATIISEADETKKIILNGDSTNGTGVNFFNSVNISSITGAKIEVTATGSGPGKDFVASTNSSIGNDDTIGDIILTADTVQLPGTFKSLGKCTIRPNADAQDINIIDGTGGLYLSDIELNKLSEGFSQIVIGKPEMTGNTTVGSYTFSSPVTLYGNNLTISNGALVDGATHDITFASDMIDIAGSVQSTGELFLETKTPSTVIRIENGTSGYRLTANDFSNLVDGFSQITIGNKDASSIIAIGDGSGKTISFTNPLTLFGQLVQMNANDTLDVNGNDLTITAEEVNLNGSVASTGAQLTLQTINPTTNIGINGGVGPFALSAADLANIDDNFSKIIFGRTDSNNSVNLGNGQGSAIYFKHPTVINSTNTNILDPVISSNNHSIDINIGIAGSGLANVNKQVTAYPLNITGGDFNDTVAMKNGITISGKVDGAGGDTNTLDYTNWTNVFLINLQDHRASNIFGGKNGGIPNIQTKLPHGISRVYYNFQ